MPVLIIILKAFIPVDPILPPIVPNTVEPKALSKLENEPFM